MTPGLATPSRGGGAGDKRAFGLGAVLLVFLAAVCLVNPLRETAVVDDWAYAQMVRHMLDTGEYRLSNWLAPNSPFHTVWGATFCRVGGFSFSTLRLSTVVMALVGLVAFRELAIEHRIRRRVADLLTLCLAVSPLFFKLSLSFMSDVPFVVTTTVALLFYTRALRSGAWSPWVLASLACAASILTRQFGAAMVGALAFAWLRDAKRMERIPRYAVGLAAPLVATLWQVNQGLTHSNWAAKNTMYHVRVFTRSLEVWENVPWRVLLVVEYMAWFLLPLALVAGIALRMTRDAGGVRARSAVLRWGLVFVATVVYGKVVMHRPVHMPFLLFDFLILDHDAVTEICATVLVVAAAAVVAPLFPRRYLLRSARPRPPHEVFLDATAFLLLLSSLAFWQFSDRYLLIFLPYAAIVIGRQLEEVLAARARVVIGACLVVLATSVAWVREDLAHDEATWALADQLRASGVEPGKIYCDWRWAGYYHFDDYARETSPTVTAGVDYHVRWMQEQYANADYLIVEEVKPPLSERWDVVGERSYVGVTGRRVWYAVRRVRRGVGG